MEVPLSEKTTPSSEGVAFRGEGEASSELTLLRPVSGVHQCHVNNNYRTVISWYISLSYTPFLGATYPITSDGQSSSLFLIASKQVLPFN